MKVLDPTAMTTAPFSQTCVSILRFIFLGLITCLSGSSYFFIIAVIIILRRQFYKPQQHTPTQSTKAARQIELQTSPKPTEDQPSTSETAKVAVEVEAEAEREDAADVNGAELLAKVARTNATNAAGSLTETTAEIAACPNGKADWEVSEQRAEVEAKRMDQDKPERQTDEEKEVEVEAPGSNTKGH